MKNNKRNTFDRKKFGIKTMYFNRYLLVRYVLALFFFSNLYWLLALLLSSSHLFFIPLILIVFLISSGIEQVKIFNAHTGNAIYTKLCFIIMFSTNIILILTTYFNFIFLNLYPFLVNKLSSKVLVSFILFIGIFLSYVVLKRLYKIKNNKDKQYKRIKQYEKAINL